MANEDEQFGKYRLVSRIAAGGMAEIYRARFAAAKGITKQVVIKRILPHYAADPHFIQMFTNEAKIAMGLSHGNIAQVFDFGEIDGDWFLAMEFIDGQALSKVIKRARKHRIPFFPTPLAALVLIETLKALQYAHTRLDEQSRPLNIVHRDVSPQNVLVSYEGQVKLVDFGIAKAKYGQENTQSGNIKGKYIYFSPEQARGKPLDARTDVFACGTMLYELLTGQLPFQGKLIEVLGKIIRGEFTPPTELNPEIPAALERILLKAMALDVAERYQSAGEFERALSSWLHANAPGFSFDTLAQFMGMLFENELAADGRPPHLSPQFLEQVSFWERDDIVPDQQDESSHKTQQERLPDTHQSRERQRRGKTGLRLTPLPRAALIGLPVLAMLGAGVGVYLAFRSTTFELKVSSEPPGALVRVDGASMPGTTPVVVADLTTNRPHLVQVELLGMKPWELEARGVPGSVTQMHAELERIAAPVKPVEEPSAQLDAGAAARPAPELDPGLQYEVAYPQSAFTVLPRKHVKLLPKSSAASIDLDPSKTYRVSTEGRLSFGGVVSDIFIEECVYLLEGPRVAAHEAFGILGKKPLTVSGATRLYALVSDEKTSDNSGAIKVKVQARGEEPRVLLVDAQRHNVVPGEHERITVTSLSSLSRYELVLKDGKVPARTRPQGRPGRVIFGQTTGFTVVEGKPVDHLAHRLLEVGKKYEVRGSTRFWLWFPDDDASDNQGSIEVEITPIAGNLDSWENRGKRLQAEQK